MRVFQSALASSAVKCCLFFIFRSDFNMHNSVGSEFSHWAAGGFGIGAVLLPCVCSSLGTMRAQPETVVSRCSQHLNVHSHF